MFTVSDIIHLIQYYYQCSSYDAAAADVETFRLESLRGTSFLAIFPCNQPHIDTDIEKQLGVDPPPLLREHPSATLFEAAKLLIQTHARRVPLLDLDSETGHEVIVSILTQYRLLKFISINVSNMPISSTQALTSCPILPACLVLPACSCIPNSPSSQHPGSVAGRSSSFTCLYTSSR